MLRKCVAEIGGHPVLLLDTITALTPADEGAIAISGSHGGSSSGVIALGYRPAIAVFNDAGVGKDGAGIVALDLFNAAGHPALTVSHLSARIGDAADMWENGIISHVNEPAKTAGFMPGGKLQDGILNLGGRFGLKLG